MRTGFELKFMAKSVEEAKSIAISEVARFLEIPEDSVEDYVSIEFRVSYASAEKVEDIEASLKSKVFQVIAYGSVKQSASRPFGF